MLLVGCGTPTVPLTVVEEIKNNNNVWRPYVDTLLHCIKFCITLPGIIHLSSSSIYLLSLSAYMCSSLYSFFSAADKEMYDFTEPASSPLFPQERLVASLCALVIVQ